MKGRIILSVILAASVLLVAKVASASMDNRNMGRRFDLPGNTQKISENTYYLGEAKDTDGTVVEGYAFLKKRNDQAKPERPGKGGGSTCYGFLASGAKWKNVEDWIVNSQNVSTLNGSFVAGNLSGDIGKWEAAAGRDILGNGSSTNEDLVADTVSPDNANEIYFADITESNAIAITIVWGVFGGPPQSRYLAEWDQVYDDIDYLWSGSGEAEKMDFENIATHELGHSVGLNDQYNSTCLNVTMYGYAGNGETNKRTLEPPDILGVRTLYQ